MKIYNSQIWGEGIDIREYIVAKETKKYYICTNGWRIEKVLLNKCDKFGEGWARTKKHAVTVLFKNVNKEIKETEKKLVELKESLTLPIDWGD